MKASALRSRVPVTVVFAAALTTTLSFGASTLAQPARPATAPAARPATAPAARPATAPAARPVTAPAAQPAAPAAQTTPAAPAAQTTPAAPAAQTTPVAVVTPAAPVAAPVLRIAASSALNGQFATLTCGEGGAAAAVSTLSADFAGEPDALALDAGDFVGASATARFSVSHDAAGVASAAAAMNLRAMALGHRDLAAPRETTLAAATALTARHIPYVLSNLACEGAARSLCDAVSDSGDDPVILDTPQGRVAYIAIVSPSALRFVAADRAAGVTLQAPAEALPRAVHAARERGARWVVAAYDPEWPGSEDDAVHLASELPEDGRPDVLLVNDVSEGFTSLEAARSGVRVVATRPARAVAVELGGPRLVREARSGAVPEAVTTLSTATHTWLCETQNRALAGAALTAPLDRDGFTTFFLNVMRDETETEVAIINRGAVQGRELFPLTGNITALQLAAILPFDDQVYTGRVLGSVLKALATSSRAERLMLRGVTVSGGTVKINGRDVEANSWYTVSTSRFIADGGEGGLGGNAESVEMSAFGALGPRELFSAWLERPHTGDITQLPVDPARRTRWTFNASVDFGFNLVNVANPAGSALAGTTIQPYGDAQLSRSDSMSLRGDVQLFANADHPDWNWRNAFRARYGRASVGSGPFNENLDLVTLRSNFTYTGLSSGAHWYVPTPDLEVYAETEFDRYPRTQTVLDGSVGDYHHFQLRPTLGAQFTFNSALVARLAAGMDWKEVLQTGTDPTYVFLARVTLSPFDLFTVRGRAVTWNAEAEFAVREAFSDSENGPNARDGQLRLNTRLAFPVVKNLSLTLGYDLFGHLARGNELGIAHDVTLGVAWTGSRAVQTFGH